jgi:hypothetical protein
MKTVNIFIKSVALFMLISLGSCEDFLDAPSKSTLDPQDLFSNPAAAQQAIAGIIQSFGETNSYRGRYIAWYGLNTDCEVSSSYGSSNTDDKMTLGSYNTSPTNGQMDNNTNAWAKFYEAIERANIAIVSLRKYGDIEHRPEMAEILGEFLTLRAVVYNDLLRGWGNVPARFVPVDPLNTKETAFVPKSDRDVVLKQLLADLEEAGRYCNWPKQNKLTSSTENISKSFVKGLRARLALAAGGYSTHLDGQVHLSTDPDLSPEKMYAIAKQECLDVINERVNRLQGFEEAFKALHAETYVAGQEILWELPFSETRGRVIFDLGLRHTNADKYQTQAKGGSVWAWPTVYYDYEPGDIRRDVTSVPYMWTDGKQVVNSFKSWNLGKYRYEWLKRVVTNANDDGLNYLYMRYSDILLMAAEAINELDGPVAAAPYFKEVRSRAFPNNPDQVTAYMSQISVGKDAFFKAIVKERALEFTGEMLRKGDLIRWNMLKERIDDAKAKMEAYAKRIDYICAFDGVTYPYSQLPVNLYYKTASDGETIIIHGLKYGDADAAPDASYEKKGWKLDQADLDLACNQGTGWWHAIYYRNPNKQQYWPIWANFINSSNGSLNNDTYNMPE